jgi:AraC-like DNA-binding protein
MQTLNFPDGGEGAWLLLGYYLLINMANRWLPDAENFFSVVQTTLLRARQQLGSGDIDCPQYWITKLETFEETFTLLKARVLQAFPNREHLQELIGNLIHVISWLKIQLGITALQCSEAEQGRDEEQPTNHCLFVCHTGEVGRPRYLTVLNIEQEQLSFLRNDLGLRWADIARCLGISERTLRRRRYELGLISSGDFTNISDQSLDEHVRDVLQTTPRVGLSLVRGALRSRGLNIQRDRVREAMNRVDPLSRTVHHRQFITRRTYNVRSPNSLW